MQFLIGLILTIAVNAWGNEVHIPPLTAPVVDEANMLSETEKLKLSEIIYEIHTHNGPQISILTVNDLQGYAIEDFSIRVAENWKLGTKEKGNGLLIIAAKAERKIRIEVGDGLEGDITDYEAKKYITQIITPAFKNGEFYQGFLGVLLEVANKFNIKLEGAPRRVMRRHNEIPIGQNQLNFIFIAFAVLAFVHLLLRNHPIVRGIITSISSGIIGYFLAASIATIIIILVISFFIGILGLNNILYTLGQANSHGGRYGGGGGFGGGGGWSGGGGGFSGGGSSGDW